MARAEGSKLFYSAAALVAAALLLGGGGAVWPLQNLLVQLVGLTLLVVALWRGSPAPFDKSEKAACLLLLLIVVTPLLHLVPLPPNIWQSLSGRQIVLDIKSSIGGALAFAPLSIDPESTWLAAAYLIPAAAIFLAVLKLPYLDCRRLVLLVVVSAMASLALGALQLASGGAFHLYDTAHRGYATGLFINRNHQADLMLVGMILTSAIIWSGRQRGSRFGPWLATIAAFSAGTLATGSRMALLLLPIAILASTAFLPFSLFKGRRLLLTGGAAAVAALLLAIGASSATQGILARFETFSDIRFDYWPDVLFVAWEFFPGGSGAGTFATAYGLFENLNRLAAPYLNHAHNEYLEILVEAGLWGVLLTALFLAGFAWLSLRKAPPDPLRRAASFSILILLLHSIGDYPLRMLSLLTLFGLLCGLLVRRSAPVSAAAAGGESGLKPKENLLGDAPSSGEVCGRPHGGSPLRSTRI